MAAEFPLSLEFAGQPDRFADKRVFEIRIVGIERAIIMSKRGPMQPRPIFRIA
jgi:hypothetical protein